MKKEKKNNYVEPEERDDNTGNTSDGGNDKIKDTDMLTDAEVIDRSHAKPPSGGPTVDEWTPPPSYSGDDDLAQDEETKDKQQTSQFANEKLHDLPEEEKIDGATHFTKGILDGASELITEAGNLFLPIRRRRWNKLVEQGEINPSIIIHYNNGSQETAEAAKERYNQKATNALYLSQSFREEATPIIAAELAKKGIGLTPMQYLLFVALPLEAKRNIQVAIEIRSVGNDIIEAIKAATQYHGAYGGVPVNNAGSPGNSSFNQDGAGITEPDEKKVEDPIQEFGTETGSSVQQPAQQFQANPGADQFDSIQSGRGQGGAIPPDERISPGIYKKNPGKSSRNNSRVRNSKRNSKRHKMH